jgi:hypothetical protein
MYKAMVDTTGVDKSNSKGFKPKVM